MESIIDPTRVRCIRKGCGAFMMCMFYTGIDETFGFKCKCGVTATLRFNVPKMTNTEKMEEKFTRKNIYLLGDKKPRNKIRGE